MPGVLASTMAMSVGTIRAVAFMSGALEQDSNLIFAPQGYFFPLVRAYEEFL